MSSHVHAALEETALEFLKDPLLQTRYALFLGYYMDTLFKTREDLFKSSLEMLLTSIAFEDPARRAIALQSADTLRTIIIDEDLRPRIGQLTPFITPLLANYCEKLEVPKFFDFLSDYVGNFASHISAQDLGTLLQCLVKRLIGEKESLTARGMKNNNIVTELLSVLQRVAEQEAFVPLVPEIELLLTPVLELLRRPNEIDFEDEILCIFVESMQRTKTLTRHAQTALELLPGLFKKYDCLFGSLL